MCHIHSIRSIHYQYTLAIHPVNNTSIPPTLSHPSSPPLIPSPHPLPLSSPPLSHRPSGVLGVPRGSPVPGLRGVHPLHLPHRHLPHASRHHLLCAMLHRYCWCCCCGCCCCCCCCCTYSTLLPSHPPPYLHPATQARLLWRPARPTSPTAFPALPAESAGCKVATQHIPSYPIPHHLAS